MAETSAPIRCVICGKPQVEAHKPFCSKRCQQVDLNRWFSGAYAIPAAESDDPGSEDQPAAPRRTGPAENER